MVKRAIKFLVLIPNVRALVVYRIKIQKAHILKFISSMMVSVILTLTVLSGTASAKEIGFEALVNRNIVSLGQSIQLNLQFKDSKSIPAPELPDIEGFKSRYIGPSTVMSIVNGEMLSSVTHIYKLVPLKTGKFKIGPISFKHKGNTYVSNVLTVEVVDSITSKGSLPQRHKKAETTLKDRLFLKIVAEKTTAYINEMIPLSIKLYINSLSIRNIQYPEFIHDGFFVEEFGKPLQYQETKDGIVYDVVEFKTKLFGTQVGEFSLGPAKLQADLVIKEQRLRPSSIFEDFFGRNPFEHDPFEDFFSGYSTEPVELDSDKVALTIIPLPNEKRPSDFDGAVGNFDFNLKVSPQELKAGDPLILKMTISGDGNFNTVTAPRLKQDKDFKVYEPQIKQQGNKKIFEQILIPLNDSVKEVPEIAFSFFNTEKGRYETLSEGPVPLVVTKPDKKEELTIMEASQGGEKPLIKEKFGRDIIYIKESPGKLKNKDNYLYKNIYFLLLQAIPLLLLVTALIYRKRKEKLATDTAYARRLSAPKKAKKGMKEAKNYLRENKVQEFYGAVFRTIKEYIGDRFHLPAGGITADVVDEKLGMKGIDTDVMVRLKNIFQECDIARYAPTGFNSGKMEMTLKDLKEVIDYFEKGKI